MLCQEQAVRTLKRGLQDEVSSFRPAALKIRTNPSVFGLSHGLVQVCQTQSLNGPKKLHHILFWGANSFFLNTTNKKIPMHILYT